MKTMKKLFALLVAVALTVSMAVVASAETASIKITMDEAGDYNAYQLLTVTGTGDDMIYNLNSKYTAAFTAVTGKSTEQDILACLADSSLDIRVFADAMYREIVDEELTADASVTDGTELTGAPGYYLIADVTDLDGEEDDANSLVMIETGSADVSVNTKKSVPEVEKKVKETNDSTGDVSDWQDAADYDIGDDVPFQFTGTLPTDFATYETYEYIFHDEACDGLSFNNDVVVTAGGKTVDEDCYTVVTTGLSDDCDFEIVFTDLKTIVDEDGEAIALTSASEIVVTYTMELTDDAELGATGNPNTVYLEFSNNPYDEGTGVTPEDKVIVFTFEVDLTKTDGADAALAGAGFTLFKLVKDDEVFTAADTIANLLSDDDLEEVYGDDLYISLGALTTTADDNTLEWTGLDSGNYVLIETTVPDNYNKADDLVFDITATYPEEDDEPSLTEATDTTETMTYADSTGIFSTTVVNQFGTVLPSTGGTGTKIFYTVGAILFLGAGVLLVSKKRMSAEA